MHFSDFQASTSQKRFITSDNISTWQTSLSKKLIFHRLQIKFALVQQIDIMHSDVKIPSWSEHRFSYLTTSTPGPRSFVRAARFRSRRWRVAALNIFSASMPPCCDFRLPSPLRQPHRAHDDIPGRDRVCHREYQRLRRVRLSKGLESPQIVKPPSN